MRARRFVFFIIFFPFFSSLTNAQLCSGSLGDPVVHLTFGAGNNPGAPLPGTTTTYQYVSGGCPNDGQYTIVNSTANCFGNTWITIPYDHTGDPNGYFMLVNASIEAQDFYIDTIKGLCAGTTYEFAAWIVNILKTDACNGTGIEPDLTFNIEKTDGTVLSNYTSGFIKATGFASWRQYGLYFTTPPNETNVVLRIRNDAPGGCGNDLALDDITFRPCGPLVLASSANSISDTISLCEYDNTTLTFNASVSAGYNNPLYQWQISVDNGNTWADIPGQTTTTLVRAPASTPGVYRYRLNVGDGNNINLPSCRVSSNVLTVMVNPKPVPVASVNNPLCNDSIISLSASGGGNYMWIGPGNFADTILNGSSPASANISHASSDNNGKYYVTVTSTAGCVNKDSVTVIVNPNPVATAGNDITLCKGSTTTLTASGGTSYIWSPSIALSANNIANPQADPDTTVTYIVTVYNQYQCSDTASVTVNVIPTPVANAGPDKKIMEGQSVTLEGSVNTPDVTISWTPVNFIDNPASLQPTVTPQSDITYTLKVTSTVGCGVSTDNVFIRVFEKITIPNAFSPNGDGINDVWNIKNLITYPEAEIEVFNRYGQPVFHSSGYNKPWDGTLNGKSVPSGTYYYIIDLKNDFPKLSGSVFVVR
ncbi:MAG: gliding motility-associated C-terminal domain-containing protein [Bacteroidetes bacterium]|nr:gliding motility-associated C-terminal domain-containing protein [Bacteroidota bacterium]